MLKKPVVHVVTPALSSIATKTTLRGLSPRANYTDRATAACRRSYCQLLRIEGATWSSIATTILNYSRLLPFCTFAAACVRVLCVYVCVYVCVCFAGSIAAPYGCRDGILEVLTAAHLPTTESSLYPWPVDVQCAMAIGGNCLK
jgi:hypothetical protein